MPMPLLYRRSDLAYCDIARAAQRLLVKVGESEERYDIVERMLIEAGITPNPSRPCNVIHAEEFDERVSTFADLLFDQVATNEGVHQAVTAVLIDLFAKRTIETPLRHLTEREQREYVLCAASETVGAASLYMDCAKRRAHVGACRECELRVERYGLSMLGCDQGDDDDGASDRT